MYNKCIPHRAPWIESLISSGGPSAKHPCFMHISLRLWQWLDLPSWDCDRCPLVGPGTSVREVLVTCTTPDLVSPSGWVHGDWVAFLLYSASCPGCQSWLRNTNSFCYSCLHVSMMSLPTLTLVFLSLFHSWYLLNRGQPVVSTLSQEFAVLQNKNQWCDFFLFK